VKPFIATIVIGASLAACAFVPMGDLQQDAALKTFVVAPDEAGIYIYRNEGLAMAVKMDVHLDGAPLGQTAGGTYLYKAVAPGKHWITSGAENTDTLEIEISASSIAYVWQEVKMGILTARTKLHLMNEAEGKKGVLETKLAESKSPTQAIEVRVEAVDPAWDGSLECQASNSFGNWPFVAPGTVTVELSTSPLQIRCKAPVGATAEASATAPSAGETAREGARKGTTTGAKIGAGAGVALGVAAVPVMGPVFAVLLVVGGAMQGAEIGGVVGTVTAGDRMGYPSPIIVQFKHTASSD
jgi:hypothetical protein